MELIRIKNAIDKLIVDNLKHCDEGNTKECRQTKLEKNYEYFCSSNTHIMVMFAIDNEDDISLVLNEKTGNIQRCIFEFGEINGILNILLNIDDINFCHSCFEAYVGHIEEELHNSGIPGETISFILAKFKNNEQ